MKVYNILLYRKLNIYMSRLKSGIQSIAKYWMLGFSLERMRVALISLTCILLLFSTIILAQEEKPQGEKAGESAVSEMREPELPPAIQELLQKEMEKLPPVEKHFRMAQDYHARGKLDEAIKELELALEEDPKHVPSNCELGIIYMGKGDYDKAIEQLNKTLELDPVYPKTHYALANAYARKPNPDVALARKHLDEAIRLGYHAVPWFLDYMKKLEGQAPLAPEPAKVQERVIPETSSIK